MSESLIARFEKCYPKSDPIRFDLDLSLDRFWITILLGPSGCGKTTVLRSLAGLIQPELGSISLGSHVWFDHARGIFLGPQARDIGFLFQDLALFPHLSVENNIGFGLDRKDPKIKQKRVAELIDQLELSGLEKRFPSQISGGQQQRVALARAVARKPKLLLLDEPLSSLDNQTRDRMRPQLRQILEEFGIPVIMVTHDRLDAISLGDHLIVMKDGNILEHGPLKQVFSSPHSWDCAKLLGMENLINGEILEHENGQCIIGVGTFKLRANCPKDWVGKVKVGIWAEEIKVGSNETNALGAIVKTILQEGPITRLGLDCGFPLVVRAFLKPEDRETIHLGQILPVSVAPTTIHLMKSLD